MHRRLLELTGVGVSFGSAGLLLAVLARGVPSFHTASVALVSAMLTSLPLWQLIVTKNRLRWWATSLIGGGIGLLAHPVFFYLMFESYWVMQKLGCIKTGVGGPAPGPLVAIEGALLYTLFSWLIFGLPTLLLGFAAGLLSAFWRAWLLPPEELQ